MSTSAPAPLPATATASTSSTQQTGADHSAAPPAAPPAQGSLAIPRLIARFYHALSKPPYAAIFFAVVVLAASHFLSDKLDPHRIKLFAAGAFAATLYGVAALHTRDPAVGLRGLSILTGTASSATGMSVPKRLLAAWYVTFPAIAVAAAFVNRLSPTTMLLAADAGIMLPYVIQQQMASASP